MNNFEFLRDLTIGQYLPTGSPIHRLDSRMRLVLFTAVILAATFATTFSSLLALLGFVLLLLLLSRVPPLYALRGLLPPLPFLIFIALIQAFFNPRGEQAQVVWQYHFLQITQGGLWNALLVLLRFAVLILGLSLTSFCLSTSDLNHGLEALLRPLARWGLPVYDIVLTVQITLRFLPFLAQSAERIAKAQASRGAEWGVRRGSLLQRARQIVPLIVPLFLSSLKRAENLALAMDARSYDANPQRTSMVEAHWGKNETLAAAALALLLAAVIWLG